MAKSSTDIDIIPENQASNGNKPKEFHLSSKPLSLLGSRLPIQKTYKLYIGGKFPRTESGRYFQLKNNDRLVANICRSSRKDVRNSVKAARATFSGDWAKRAAFNRGHIMYRIAEMLEWRKEQFIEELTNLGTSRQEAEKELFASIDRVIYYAGWSDKFQQIFSSVNPVSSSHFNFSMYEPTGVVCIVAPEETGLLGLVSTVIPVIVGGNTCIVVPSTSKASLSITFGEVLHTSDVTGGAVNILTGYADELGPHMATHMDVNAVIFAGKDQKLAKEMQGSCSLNVKRFIDYTGIDWNSEKGQSPYFILDSQEVKTTWHPIGF